MKSLIVEDDFTCRLVIQKLLLPYGETHIAVNGREALDMMKYAIEEGEPYDLVCMDVMMPQMDGQEALRRIRALETMHNMPAGSGSRIIMTTALGDRKNVMTAFNAQCDAYLVKPIDRAKLQEHLRSFGLIEE